MFQANVATCAVLKSFKTPKIVMDMSRFLLQTDVATVPLTVQGKPFFGIHFSFSEKSVAKRAALSASGLLGWKLMLRPYLFNVVKEFYLKEPKIKTDMVQNWKAHIKYWSYIGHLVRFQQRFFGLVKPKDSEPYRVK